jgi:hypothetical protein
MLDIKKILSSLKSEQDEPSNGSTAVSNIKLIKAFATNINNPFIVSFPRTGSHWLRMIMELYFQRPSLIRVFYYPERTDYLTLHTHDKKLDVERENVIYLYRDPVDTVYSQMNYYREDLTDQARIKHWADQYGQHLDKWLYLERFTKKKTAITYEGMKNNMVNEFAKITKHFGQQLNSEKLETVAARITKDEVRKKTLHDKQVIQLNADYADLRITFNKQHCNLIWDALLDNRTHLEPFFTPTQINRSISVQ